MRNRSIMKHNFLFEVRRCRKKYASIRFVKYLDKQYTKIMVEVRVNSIILLTSFDILITLVAVGLRGPDNKKLLAIVL